MIDLPPRRNGSFFLIKAGIVILAMVAAMGVYRNLEQFPRTGDATIRANVIGVAPQVGGSLVEIAVTDNQAVKPGYLLFKLDDRPYRARAAAAKARLELVRTEVAALKAGIAVAEAGLAGRRARAEYAAAHYERLKPLLAGNFASADRVEKARAESESAMALVREAEADIVRAVNSLGEVDGRNTRIEEAEAELADAELQVAYCRIESPGEGFVTDLQITPGAYAGPGQQMFSIVNSSAWFVLANFRETDLRRIRAGQKARVFLMSRPGKAIDGIVQGVPRAVDLRDGSSRVSPGGQGVLENVNPTIDFIQLAQRFPVRILLENTTSEDLRMGGRASVIVDTRSEPDLQRLQSLEQREVFVPDRNGE